MENTYTIGDEIILNQ